MATARLLTLNKDYERLGQKKGTVELWEDGLRTSGKFGEYEWWYSDFKLEDGTSLVIVFFTAPVTATTIGFKPSVSFSYTKKDGTLISESLGYNKNEASYDKEKCNVKIKNNYIEGDLHTYKIHYESENIKADITLINNTSSWRPETGRIDFTNNKYFAWLPSVPEGNATISMTINGENYHLKGTGYHDHNWGNTAMFWLMHHWYWGRAKVGDYQIISSYITANKKHNYEHFKIFLLSKNGQKLADNGNYVTYKQLNPEFDPVTKKDYFKTLIYDYNDGTIHYEIIYQMQEIIEYFTYKNNEGNAAASCPEILKSIVSLLGLDPSYIRMTGTATVRKYENNKIIEEVSSPAIWELMYFGKNQNV